MDTSTITPVDANTLYNPENGILRMFSDLESYIYPVFMKSQPLLYALAKISFVFIPALFLILLAYIVFRRKHHFFNKFKKKYNYIFWAIALIAYTLLAILRMSFPNAFSIYGYTSVDPSRLVLPVIAKFFGPYIAAIFAVLQYLIMSAVSHRRLSIILALIPAISGFLYSLFFYRKRTKYTRCLAGKIVISLVCNVFLNIFATYSYSSTDIAYQMTITLIDAILVAPVQAAFIYLLFRLIRLTKKHH